MLVVRAIIFGEGTVQQGGSVIGGGDMTLTTHGRCICEMRLGQLVSVDWNQGWRLGVRLISDNGPSSIKVVL